VSTEAPAPSDPATGDGAPSPFRARGPIDDATAVEVLAAGRLEILGRMPWTSNATFLVDVTPPDDGPLPLIQGVYKPGRGERPLPDFPPGLYRREAAAWELAHLLGWGLVPPTIVRDGPFGEGSVQLYVPCDYEEHYFTLHHDPDRVVDLRRLAAFDLVANNADRKAGHVLAGLDGHLWAIDNALCFHHQFKVRTVVWDFAGDPIGDDLAGDLGRLLSDGLSDGLADLLDPFERDAVVARARAVLDAGELPADPSGRRVPWPLV